jgi:epoxyqueuosine reductase
VSGNENKTPSQRIKEKALAIGFDDCGISKAVFLKDDSRRLKEWLLNDMHGEMHYMENHFEKRVDPTKLVEGAKSVITVLLNYYPKESQTDSEAPVLSKYAYGEDYHDVVRNKLKQLFDFINTDISPIEGRCFVDSAPVLDRVWAKKAGLGWIGKNSMLISPKHGSFVFIGHVIVNIDYDYNTNELNDFCGDCSRCIKACPTGAIVKPKIIDSRKCISYLTIEYKEENIPEEFKDKFQNRVFGCDICQDVCPWNRKVKPTSVDEFSPSFSLLEMSRKDWGEIDEEKFKSLFKKSAVKRTKFKGLKRNLDFLGVADEAN